MIRTSRTMVLPLFKLGTLALRTLSKPIANRLKKNAGLHPKFREFIINIAQDVMDFAWIVETITFLRDQTSRIIRTNHRFTTTVQRRIYGHATDVLIRPLDEGKAVQVASELLGEIFVFAVAGIALIYEVHRNARSEARKEERRKQELEALKQKNRDLEKEMELLKCKLQFTQGRGFTDFFKLWQAGTLEDQKSGRPSYMPAM